MPARGHYLRRDLPDGHAELLTNLAGELLEGADDLRRGSQSRQLEERYHAAIDGHALMRRIAERLTRAAKAERMPG